VSFQGAQCHIREVVGGWDEVTAAPHRFGGVEFRLGKRELGHIHGDSLVDIPFPKHVRDEMIAGGEAEPHRILTETGWVRVFLRSNEDVERAIRLLQHSFSLAVAHRQRVATAASSWAR
jgi:Family of unknown function (DUF5519)